MMERTMTICRSCGAEIVWARTESGKAMPVDAEPDPNGNLALSRTGAGVWRVAVVGDSFTGPRYRPHFASCPDADSWRNR